MLVLMPAFSQSREGVARTNQRSRKDRSPTSMGRAADPDIPAVSPTGNMGTALTRDIAGGAALALIHFPWQELGYDVKFMGRRLGYRALTLVDEHRIELYIKREETPDSLAFDLAHEFGHIVDLKYNDTARRAQWLKLRGIPSNIPWYGCSACTDFDTPAGDFAEAFAYLLLGPGSYHSRMAPPPKPEQIEELARLCHIEHISSSLVSLVKSAQKN
jgi:hypothetical protein